MSTSRTHQTRATFIADIEDVHYIYSSGSSSATSVQQFLQYNNSKHPGVPRPNPKPNNRLRSPNLALRIVGSHILFLFWSHDSQAPLKFALPVMFLLNIVSKLIGLHLSLGVRASEVRNTNQAEFTRGLSRLIGTQWLSMWEFRQTYPFEPMRP